MNCREQVITLAVKLGRREIIEAIMEYEKQQSEKPEPRVKLPSVSLDFMATGVPSKMQFYFPIRKVNLSRGGKEGNNAFTYDQKMRKPEQLDLTRVLKHSLPLDLFNFLSMKSTGLPISFGLSHQDTCLALGQQLKIGNFPLVKHLVERCTEKYP